MPDVFGVEGGLESQSPKKEGADAKKPPADPFFEWDNETGEITIRIPAQYREYQEELIEDLRAEFAYDVPSPEMADEIKAFIDNWLKQRGVA